MSSPEDGLSRNEQPRPDLDLPVPPTHIKLRRSGRWVWYADIRDGIGITEGFFIYGSQKRAQRRARQILEKYMRDKNREELIITEEQS